MAATRELLGEERREQIRRWLATEGKVLASDGALRRVHGGALPPAPGPPRFVDRRADDTQAKAAIAAAAVRLVRPGEVVALSGGTTILEFAPRLPDDLRATVIAMSPDIAVALADHPGLTVDVLGGRLHPDARTVTGPESVDALRRVRPDVCVLSACSLHPAVGMTLRDRGEALVVGEMVARSGRVLSLTTATKLGSAGPYPIASLGRIDTLET